MRQRSGYAALAVAGLLGACAGVGPQPPLPVSEVVTLSKAGSPPAQILSRLQAARTTYALRGSDFGKLADLGLKPEVLDSLQAEFVRDVDLLTRNSALGASLGGCASCYPQPLELSNLATGGNGMSAARPSGNYEGGGRPPGVPGWVPASPGTAFKGAGVTVDRIAEQARAGASSEELVRRIRETPLDRVIAQGDIGVVSTRLSVGLPGSQLAALHQQGVPDPVLDALQEKYLAEFVEFQRQRYQTWGKGGGGRP